MELLNLVGNCFNVILFFVSFPLFTLPLLTSATASEHMVLNKMAPRKAASFDAPYSVLFCVLIEFSATVLVALTPGKSSWTSELLPLRIYSRLFWLPPPIYWPFLSRKCVTKRAPAEEVNNQVCSCVSPTQITHSLPGIFLSNVPSLCNTIQYVWVDSPAEGKQG